MVVVKMMVTIVRLRSDGGSGEGDGDYSPPGWTVCKTAVVRVTEINHHGWTVYKAVVVKVMETNPPGWIECKAAVVMETNLLVGLCAGR